MKKANVVDINQELGGWKGNAPEDIFKKIFINAIRERTNFRQETESVHAVIGATNNSHIA